MIVRQHTWKFILHACVQSLSMVALVFGAVLTLTIPFNTYLQEAEFGDEVLACLLVLFGALALGKRLRWIAVAFACLDLYFLWSSYRHYSSLGNHPRIFIWQ